MMDLKIFFSPVEESVYKEIKDHSSFFSSIHVYAEKMPDYASADIAIIGLEEYRGSGGSVGMGRAATEIRKKLYRLKKGMGRYKIVDLGNIRNGVNQEESSLRIKEVCGALMENGVLPLLIGGSHDLAFGQFLAYEGLEKLIGVLNIDYMLDMDDEHEINENRKHIHRMLVHEPNYLFNYSQMGYQSYLVDQAAIALLEKLYFEAHRLGDIRKNLAEMEPEIRNADMLSFDIGAIKSADAPATDNAQPFGLTGEEACQICWYAGLSGKLSSAGFYEYNPDRDDEGMKTASVVATMTWYFVEGFYHRKNEDDFKGQDHLKYVVSMPSKPATLVFYKSKRSEKWWMEVSYPQDAGKKGRLKTDFDRNCIVPCSYADFEAANRGELPERWISTHAKLI